MEPKKILIIEDDELMLKILKFILKKEGFQLSIAKNGADAIERYPEIRPHIVLTDVMLPYKSGLEVINFIRQNYGSVPIIVLSALGEEENTVVEAFKLGADDFVAKPFNPAALLLRVKRLLNLLEP